MSLLARGPPGSSELTMKLSEVVVWFWKQSDLVKDFNSYFTLCYTTQYVIFVLINCIMVFICVSDVVYFLLILCLLISLI